MILPVFKTGVRRVCLSRLSSTLSRFRQLFHVLTSLLLRTEVESVAAQVHDWCTQLPLELLAAKGTNSRIPRHPEAALLLHGNDDSASGRAPKSDIRKFRSRPYSLDDLAAAGTLRR